MVLKDKDGWQTVARLRVSNGDHHDRAVIQFRAAFEEKENALQ